MDQLTRKVIDALIDWGADLVGIASVDRFADAPEGHRPTDFMPECKTVISVGLHLHQGTADVWTDDPSARDKTNSPYLFYGYGLTNLESSRIVNRMAKTLEYKGYKTLCFLPTWLTSMTKYIEESVTTGKLMAEFSHRHAAVAAGLGEFGWNGLAITPEFGTMVRFNSILTDAELEPTPLYDGPALCRKDQCNFKCQRICPTQALSDGVQTVAFGEKKMTYAEHNPVRCGYGITGLVKGAGGRSELEIPEDANVSHLLKDLDGDEANYLDKAMRENCFGIICGDFCGKCLHQCPASGLSRKDLESYDMSMRNNSLSLDVLG